VWTPEYQTAFKEVRARPLTLQTDESDYGIGAILTQETDRGEKVISYSSRKLAEIYHIEREARMSPHGRCASRKLYGKRCWRRTTSLRQLAM